MHTLSDVTVPTAARTRALGRTIRTAATVLVLLAAVLASLAGAHPAAAADVTFNQKMLELVNQQRAAAGVAPVQESASLTTIAGDGPYSGCGGTLAGRAVDMGQRSYFSHTILNCGVQSVFNILQSVGLNYSAAGENIGWMNGTTDPSIAAQNLMSSLMSSPGHKANILDPRFNTIGIGSWHTNPGQTWTGGGSPLGNVWITAQVFAQLPVTTTAPAFSATPTALGFPDRQVGSAAPAQAVTVKNTGSATLTISATSLTGANPADFVVTSNGCGTGIGAGSSCSIGIGFTPGAAGSRSATLSISDNAPGSPHAVTLSGNGTAAAAALTAAPTNVAATGGDGQMTVTWSAPASGPTPAGYGVFAYDAGGYTGKSAWVCGTCTSAVVAGLGNGKQDYAMVYGYNGSAWGAAGSSNWVSVLAVPGPPANVAALPGNGAVAVSWQAPANPGTGIDGYGVFAYNTSGYAGKYSWVCATCTTATVAGLTNGQTYYLAVYAHNANGWGALTASAWVVAGAPGTPGNVVATKGSGSASVSWSPAPAGAAPTTGYGAFAYDAAGYTGKFVSVCATCTTGTITGLTAGHQYTVLVYGYNDYGWGVAATSNPVTP